MTFIPISTDQLKNGIHSKVELENICLFHAEDLNFNGNKCALLMAITGNESSFGLNNVPRFELGYSRSSLAYKRSALLQEGYKLYGDLCAMSYGAHQILWISARELGYPIGLNPLNLQSSNVSIPYVVDLINKLIKQGADTVEKIGIAYNSGIGGLNVPNADAIKYSKKLRNYYEQLNS